MAQMKRLYLTIFFVVLLSLSMAGQAASAVAATLLSAEKASQILAIENLTIKDGAVSGDLVNKSGRLIRNVELQIRYSWRWKNEFRPKDESPGDTVIYTVEKEISPGGKARFDYRPASPLSSRPDGYYETTVSIAGFTEIIR